MLKNSVMEQRKPSGYWNSYEHCHEEAKKYKTKKEFGAGNCGAYRAAIKHKWIDEWFEDQIKKPGYWSKERCYEVAKECKSRSDFGRKYPRAYAVAIENKWINEWDWLKRCIHEGNDYWVYSYEDYENKVAYVGLTWQKARHSGHKQDKTCVVNKYFTSIGKQIPKPIIKINGLSAEEAQYYEDWYKQKYEEEGWRVLNIAATGVGVGSLGGTNILWDYEKAKNEADKYKTKEEFRQTCGGAWGAARRNGWLKEWFGEYKAKPAGYWTKERCIEESKKYRTRSEFAKSAKTAYGVSLTNGWLDEMDFEVLRKPMGYWTYERCKEEAKKYRILYDFIKWCPSAYNVSFKNGWLKDFGFEEGKKPNGYWKEYEHCKEVAIDCTTPAEFRKKYYAAHYWSKKFGWLNEFFPENVYICKKKL